MTTTTPHTPGPWRIEITNTGFRITHSDSDLRSHIATLHESALCEEHGDTFANANLIANAPALLEQLTHAVDILAALETLGWPGLAISAGQGNSDVLRICRAAIAQAKGGEK